MNISLKSLIVPVVMLLLAATAYIYHGKYQDVLKRAESAESKLSSASQTIEDMQTRQRDVAALDAKYTKELADAKAQNDSLKRKLDNGGRVLVKGKCPVPATTETSSASGVGNDATVELSSVAGRNVLGIRDGIISDQTALRALQEYINTQCLR
ncbi:lysis protein [Salmonella enterica subsp. enterica serovar Montevideo]|nr:lysis protein [Salmonella enterica subsp. enterica serovar Montevideo]ELM5048695.1 lysis protein [Salmonella enterica]